MHSLYLYFICNVFVFCMPTKVHNIYKFSFEFLYLMMRMMIKESSV